MVSKKQIEKQTESGKIYRSIVFRLCKNMNNNGTFSAYDITLKRLDKPDKEDIIVQNVLKKMSKVKLKSIVGIPRKVYSNTLYYINKLVEEGRLEFIEERDAEAPIRKKVYRVI